jgi:anaerobic ribonucleoside-triphosphate reductase activating protein
MWAHELSVIGRAVKEMKLSVMTYTGYIFEELLELAKKDAGVHELLTVTDLLIDGPYIEKLRDLTLRFRGSSNQRILDITAYPVNKTATIIEN